MNSEASQKSSGSYTKKVHWMILRIDPMVSGSSPTSAKLSLSQWFESPALCNSRRRNHEVWSHREEGPGHCSISKELPSVQISTFDI